MPVHQDEQIHLDEISQIQQVISEQYNFDTITKEPGQ